RVPVLPEVGRRVRVRLVPRARRGSVETSGRRRDRPARVVPRNRRLGPRRQPLRRPPERARARHRRARDPRPRVRREMIPDDFPAGGYVGDYVSFWAIWLALVGAAWLFFR